MDLQRKKRLRLGEALVQLEFLSPERVDALLETFHAEQAPFQGSDATLSGDLEGNPIAAFILDFIPKITMRVSRIHLKVASSNDQSSHQSTASIKLNGAPGLTITLSADDDFANKLMIGMVRIMSGNFEAEPEPDDDREDLLGEFLSIVAGHTLGVMEGAGNKLTVEPPTYGELEAGGTWFNLVSPHGAASLSLKTNAA